MNNDIETLLKNLADKALAKKEAGFFVGLLLTIIIAVGLFFLTRKLDEQAAELAKMKAHAELDRLDAKDAVHRAMMTAIESDRRTAEERARVHLMTVKRNQEMLEEMSQTHEAQVAAVQSIKQNDWDALNKLAGVQ